MFKTHRTIYFILAILAAVGIAVGLLFAIQNFKTEEEVLISSTPLQGGVSAGRDEVDGSGASEIKDWQAYRSEELGFEFKYPDKLKLKEQDGKVTLRHQIPYKNYGDCDMLGGEVEYPTLDDFVMTIELANGKRTADFVDGNYDIGSLTGVYNIGGPEGCGETTYYFPFGNKTLIVALANVQALSGISTMWNEKDILAIPGVILPVEKKNIFNEVLSTFRLLENVATKRANNCQNFRFDTCPQGCVALCKPSFCSPDGLCTQDCGGPGSCVNPK